MKESTIQRHMAAPAFPCDRERTIAGADVQWLLVSTSIYGLAAGEN